MFGVRAGMRSAGGPSSSRRHAGIEPRARTSSTSPSVRSLATTLPAAPPVSFRRGFKGTVVALRGRRQEQQLGVGQFHGILHSVGDDDCRRHHRSPALAMKPAGQDPTPIPNPLVAPTQTPPSVPPKSQPLLHHLIVCLLLFKKKKKPGTQ